MFVESWSTIITLLILAVTIVFFAVGKLRSDIVAVCALLAFMLSGVLTPQEALSGFSNSIIPTLAGVFIVGGAIVRSGLAASASGKILKLAGVNQNALFMLVMLITALIGSMVSNTGTVAIMMPVVVSISLSINVSSSRFLMPLAFMSGIGGMLTLIGNPGNMVVNDVYVKAGFQSLTLFSFLPVGIASLAFGMCVLAPATSYYLSRRKDEKGEERDKGMSLHELAKKYHLDQNIFAFIVPEHSPMVGLKLADLNLTGRFGVSLQEIHRGKNSGHTHSRVEWIVPDRNTEIRGGELIVCRGTPGKVGEMAAEFRLWRMEEEEVNRLKKEYNFEDIGICELVLMSASRLVNRTVEESGLREQFGVTLLGIQRGNKFILEDFQRQNLQSGDSLLVHGTWEKLARLADYSRQWVVVGRPEEQTAAGVRRDKIPLVLGVLAFMIVGMAAGLLPTVVAVMLSAVLLIAGGCYRNVEEAYSAINWETIVMIACMLPMAIAMEKTGLIGAASEYITDFGGRYGPMAALALVYGLTSVLNIMISSTPVALLAAPVAIKVALNLGFSPLPFVYGVATAACMCFASPFSVPSNALVMSAGRYTFSDYLKIGLPLQALMGMFMVPVLAFLFPF